MQQDRVTKAERTRCIETEPQSHKTDVARITTFLLPRINHERCNLSRCRVYIRLKIEKSKGGYLESQSFLVRIGDILSRLARV